MPQTYLLGMVYAHLWSFMDIYGDFKGLCHMEDMMGISDMMWIY